MPSPRTRLGLLNLEDRLAPANLTLTNLRTVDAGNNLQPSPVFGQMLYLRANWSSTAMAGGEICPVRYTVNGIPSDSGSVNHSAGNGNWNWYRGGWYIGTSAITVTAVIDPDNVIAETDETDNSMSIVVTPVAPTDLPAKFLQPIGRTANADWAINNYADVDPRGSLAQDARGGGYEYDGHDAIDAGPWGNDGMDAGFPIYAAAGGTVTGVADGNFDRQTAATGAPGNFVRINHGNNWETLYYHFAKDTITVKVGDTVKAGQVIGLMGSSGNSTGTHLHYTAFYRGCQVEAEFAPSTYWQSPLPYAGEAPGFAMDAWVTNLNSSPDVTERFSRVKSFTPQQTGTLFFPAIIYNLRTPAFTTTATWKWYRPNGTLWNTATLNPTANYRFSWWYYSWSLGNFTGTPGTWNYALEINGVEQKRVPFTINAAGEAALRVSTATGAVVSDERTTPYTFTSTAQGGTAPTQVYTLQNHGGAALNLTGWSAPTGFSFVGSPPATLAAGATTTFTLQMNTTAVGYQFGRVLFNTNDPEHPEFTYNVEGTVTGTAPAGSPVVTLPDAALGYNFKSLPRAVAPNATFSDSDSTTFNALSVYVASGADGFDKLELRNQGTGPGQIGVSGLTVTYGGVTIGTLQAVPAPFALGVNFNTSATAAMVQAIMRNVLYSHTGTNPFYNRRAIAFAVQDSSGLASNWAFETVTPSGVERAATIAPLTNAATLTNLAFNKAGSFTDTFGNSWTGTVNYGDGAGTLPLTLNADKTFALTRTYSTAGPKTVTVTITSDTGGVRSAGFTVNVYTPPSVTGLSVNDAALQRSRITKIVIDLGASVDASIFQTPGVVNITRTTPAGGPTVNTSNGLLIAPASGLTTTLTLTFANTVNSGINHGSLADGRWQVSIPAMSYNSTADSTALRRLFGDSNNDGTVDATDLAAFGSFFGQTVPNNPYDYNSDGIIQADDLAQLGNRFGVTL